MARREMHTNAIGDVVPMKRLRFKRKHKRGHSHELKDVQGDKENAMNHTHATKQQSKSKGLAQMKGKETSKSMSSSREPLSDISSSGNTTYVTCKSASKTPQASAKATQVVVKAHSPGTAPSGRASHSKEFTNLSDDEIAFDISQVQESLLESDGEVQQHLFPLESPYDRKEAQNLIEEIEEECQLLRGSMERGKPGANFVSIGINTSMEEESVDSTAVCEQEVQTEEPTVNEMVTGKLVLYLITFARTLSKVDEAKGPLLEQMQTTHSELQGHMEELHEKLIVSETMVQTLQNEADEMKVENAAHQQTANLNEILLADKDAEIESLKEELRKVKASAEESIAELRCDKLALEAQTISNQHSNPKSKEEIVVDKCKWTDFSCQVDTIEARSARGVSPQRLPFCVPVEQSSPSCSESSECENESFLQATAGVIRLRRENKKLKVAIESLSKKSKLKCEALIQKNKALVIQIEKQAAENFDLACKHKIGLQKLTSALEGLENMKAKVNAAELLKKNEQQYLEKIKSMSFRIQENEEKMHLSQTKSGELSEQCQTLHAQIKELQNEKTNLASKAASIDKHKGELLAVFEDMQHTLQENQQQMQVSFKNASNFSDQCNRLQVQVQQLQEERNELVHQKSLIEKHEQELLSVIDEMNETLQKSQRELQQLKSENQDIVKRSKSEEERRQLMYVQIEDLSSRLGAKEKEALEADQRASVLSEQCKLLEEELKQLKLENEQIMKRGNSEEEHRQLMHVQLEDVSLRLNVKEQEVLEADQRASTLSEQCKLLEEELKQLKSEKGEVIAQSKNEEEHRQVMHLRLEDLSSRLGVKDNEALEAQQRANALSEQCKLLEEELAHIKFERDGLASTSAELGHDLHILDQKLEDQLDLVARVEDLQSDNDILMNEQKDLLTKIHDLEIELENISSTKATNDSEGIDKEIQIDPDVCSKDVQTGSIEENMVEISKVRDCFAGIEAKINMSVMQVGHMISRACSLNQMESLEESNSNCSSNFKDFTEPLHEIEKSLSEVKDFVRTVQADSAKVDSTEEFRNVQHHLDKLSSENATLWKTVHKQFETGSRWVQCSIAEKKHVGQLQQDRSRLLEELSSLLRANTMLTSQLGQAEVTVRRLQKAVSRLSSENASLCSQLVPSTSTPESKLSIDVNKQRIEEDVSELFSESEQQSLEFPPVLRESSVNHLQESGDEVGFSSRHQVVFNPLHSSNSQKRVEQQVEGFDRVMSKLSKVESKLDNIPNKEETSNKKVVESYESQLDDLLSKLKQAIHETKDLKVDLHNGTNSNLEPAPLLAKGKQAKKAKKFGKSKTRASAKSQRNIWK